MKKVEFITTPLGTIKLYVQKDLINDTVINILDSIAIWGKSELETGTHFEWEMLPDQKLWIINFCETYN